MISCAPAQIGPGVLRFGPPIGAEEDERSPQSNARFPPAAVRSMPEARRSQYGELSEAIYLTQGFAYDSAEAAEARFLEAGPG